MIPYPTAQCKLSDRLFFLSFIVKYYYEIIVKIKKFHFIMFYIGMIFALLPILLLILFILSAIIDEISIRLLNFIRLLP